jgi:hypothetical protein
MPGCPHGLEMPSSASTERCCTEVPVQVLNDLRVQDQGHLIHQMRVANSRDNQLTRVKPTIEAPRDPALSAQDGSELRILDDHADFLDSDA